MATMGLDPLSIVMGCGIGVCLGAASVARAVCKEAGLTTGPDSGSIYQGGDPDEGSGDVHGGSGRQLPPSDSPVRRTGRAGDSGGSQGLVLGQRSDHERRLDDADDIVPTISQLAGGQLTKGTNVPASAPCGKGLIVGNESVNTVGHFYVSTACQHRRHNECRMVCKFCPSKCLCPCHKAA
jgi:hypothetical protein